MVIEMFGWDVPASWRALAAAMTAFFLVLIVGRPVIGWLLRLKLRDGDCVKDSATLAKLHAAAGKSATPTMGGIVILAAFVGAMLLWAPMTSPAIILGVLLVVGFGALGAIDDWVKLNGKKLRKDGLRGRTKLLAELVAAGFAAVMLPLVTPLGATLQTSLSIPGLGGALPLGGLYIPFAMLVIVGAANAANLTDGLDGLASGVVGLAAMALAISPIFGAGLLAYLAGHPSPALAMGSGTAEFATFAAALAGSCVGFLWFNAHPAEVFMGDTGSLAIGAGLGYAALLLKAEFVLAIIGGVLVIEVLSVILQVGSFKLTGRRVLKCAPIHHHFQFLGLAENKIVIRFWIAGAIFGLVGVIL